MEAEEGRALEGMGQKGVVVAAAEEGAEARAEVATTATVVEVAAVEEQRVGEVEAAADRVSASLAPVASPVDARRLCLE